MTQPEQATEIGESAARQILLANQIDRGMDPRTAAQVVKDLGLLPVAEAIEKPDGAEITEPHLPAQLVSSPTVHEE